MNTHTSPLDQPPVRFLDEPFIAETLTLLPSVRHHHVDTIAALAPEATP